MKSFLFLLLLTLAACSKDTPKPPAVPATSVTYTDATGKTATLTSYNVSLVTPPPSSSGQERRILVLRAGLPDGSILELLYYYVGKGFPSSTGPVLLDSPVLACNYPAGGTSSGGPFYTGPTTTGALTVDNLMPGFCSGSFAGPTTMGGASVRLVFQRLPF
ncbi:hypothetical protein MUN81_07630 [Hymenobacter sp. 5317J-9]|uniref:hypothetical protein n=1 Tax=Hymenobacter sp. 5317J-9 TaxID=2932250 RepID=UPI001FD6A385|nr:hypothetical protein [Hymenobacter sp. 5317J-9]UOQ99359.1 hypothetical protein MUN81_07630 [Hymenobacter sp. 5317J-9]